MPASSGYAFFDLDGTLISEASMVSFHRHRLLALGPTEGPAAWNGFQAEAARMRATQRSRATLNEWYYNTCFEDTDISALASLAVGWLAQRRQDPAFFVAEALECLKAHRAQGMPVVLLTGSFREVVAPLAALFGASDFICAPLEEARGRYTGRLLGEPMIGEGKKAAIERFLQARGTDPALCHGYGDDDSDIPFLSALGHPKVLANGHADLLRHASAHGWARIGASEPAGEDVAAV